MYGNPHKYKMIYLYIDHGNILSYTENVQNAQAVFPPLEKAHYIQPKYHHITIIVVSIYCGHRICNRKSY